MERACPQLYEWVYDQCKEAILDLEVENLGWPRLFLDVTVRCGIPGDADSLQLAAGRAGADNAKAEADKHSRYPKARSPWKMIPLALETCGRHGRESFRYLRRLARSRLQSLPEVEDDGNALASLVGCWGADLSVACASFGIATCFHCGLSPHVCIAAGWAAFGT